MALVRASPGMRKNGAGGSPRTEVTEAMPSLISCSALAERHLVEPQRMGLAMGADGVAGGLDLADHVGIGRRHLADEEKRRLHAFAGQRVEHMVGAGRQRAVVEGEHDLMVFERQALAVLHAAEAGMLDRVDHDGATGPERIRIARALGRTGGMCRQQRHGQDDRFQALHFEFPRTPDGHSITPNAIGINNQPVSLIFRG